ncbi:hypothetical protein HY404_01695 [Candidatus Microgenomates bacterium]|nr:hypothetical protein [Candidatus Microgenomates bacterium]
MEDSGLEVPTQEQGIETPSGVENHANIADSVTEQRFQKLSDDKKENVKKIIGGGRLVRLLAIATLLVSIGCGNVEKPTLNYPPVVTPVIRSEIPPVATPTPEKPPLPPDIIPENELAQKYNTRVWNTPDIKLHIRREAVNNEPQLQDLAAGKFGGGLDIVLLDGPFIHSSFLSPEQRANLPGLVTILEPKEKMVEEERRNNFEKNKPDVIRAIQTETEALENKLKNGKIDQDYFNVQKELLKEQFKPYLEGPTTYDLIGNRYAGMYLVNMEYKQDPLASLLKVETAQQKPVLKVYILLAVGKSVINEKTIQSGQVRASVSSGFGVSQLRVEQSYPNPGKYIISTGLEGDQYPVGAQSQGFTLRHEFAHRVADHPQTDWVALEKIKQAYDAYQKGDDSGYYFVFETPEGNVTTAVHQPIQNPAI